MNQKILKEMFFQPAFDGIPSHWVVQYYEEGKAFPDAAYFKTESDALKFADNETIVAGE